MSICQMPVPRWVLAFDRWLDIGCHWAPATAAALLDRACRHLLLLLRVGAWRDKTCLQNLEFCILLLFILLLQPSTFFFSSPNLNSSAGCRTLDAWRWLSLDLGKLKVIDNDATIAVSHGSIPSTSWIAILTQLRFPLLFQLLRIYFIPCGNPGISSQNFFFLEFPTKDLFHANNCSLGGHFCLLSPPFLCPFLRPFPTLPWMD